MVDYYVYKSGSSYKIATNPGKTTFYVNATNVSGIVSTGTGLPGIVRNWHYTCIADELFLCSSGSLSNASKNTLTFSWDAPVNDGGSSITGYVIRPRDVVFIGITGVTGVGECGIPNNAYSAWSGVLDQAPYDTGLLTLYDDASTYVLNNVSCGRYAYQIAAINANGTGLFVPRGTECTLRGSGWTDCGCKNITVAYGSPYSKATYTYISNEYCDSGNYSTALGYLKYWNNGPSDVILTASSSLRGTIEFITPTSASGRWLYFDLYETLRANQCSGYIVNCPPHPFYYNGTGYCVDSLEFEA